MRSGQRNVSQSKGDYNAIPELPVILANKEKLLTPAGQKIADTVLTDIVAAGNTNPEAELVLTTGIKMVQQGKLTQREWKEGMQNFYQSALNLKAATGGYSAFALPMPDSYNINVSRLAPQTQWWERIGNGLGRMQGIPSRSNTPGVPKGTTQFDLTKPSDYDTIFTMMMSQDRAAKLMEGVNQ